MEFTKADLVHIENLIRALKKAKFDLDGMEVLAFAELMKWVNKLYTNIQTEIQKNEKDVTIKEPKNAIITAPMDKKIPKINKKGKKV